MVKIFIQCTSSSIDLTVKISESFEQQTNYEKQNTQPLLGYESIYTEQTMRVKDLKLLLRLPTLMWRLLLIFFRFYGAANRALKIRLKIPAIMQAYFYRELYYISESQILSAG